ncbi:hypothetical protein C4D33_10810 [Clostridium perfringens]|uniref:hypothetical protein n=1 Tax=Clostridium perfringens TaxID=1502 RepID=UPI0023F94079|nr:hypothetical protein [Clostridium perfringens]MDU0865977.1 hypothetical protein [Clostridium perfringens]MDU2504614.1 hypothetical protein [Clostridium perfringens]MDU6349066.1 hypothetical protein [Clostridium perfringens]WEV23519.1 hypothetical protein PL327_07425 [Clostridium perfringens D]
MKVDKVIRGITVEKCEILIDREDLESNNFENEIDNALKDLLEGGKVRIKVTDRLIELLEDSIYEEKFSSTLRKYKDRDYRIFIFVAQ